MSLLNPGPGDLLDRLSVLELKILYSIARENPIEHFVVERDMILLKLNSGYPTGKLVSVLDQILRLAAINGLIWQMIEKTRRVKRLPANHATKLQELNDGRQALVEGIHKTVTGENRSEEKLR